MLKLLLSTNCFARHCALCRDTVNRYKRSCIVMVPVHDGGPRCGPNSEVSHEYWHRHFGTLQGVLGGIDGGARRECSWAGTPWPARKGTRCYEEATPSTANLAVETHSPSGKPWERPSVGSHRRSAGNTCAETMTMPSPSFTIRSKSLRSIVAGERPASSSGT